MRVIFSFILLDVLQVSLRPYAENDFLFRPVIFFRFDICVHRFRLQSAVSHHPARGVILLTDQLIFPTVPFVNNNLFHFE